MGGEDQIAPFGAQPRGGALTAVRRAIIDDPKYAPGRAVRLLTHDLRDQAVERGNPGLALTAAEQLGAMDVPGSNIGPSTGAGVFVLDVNRPPRCWRE